jgi:CDP-2,3-bis-(O-geranylgeranyl)-sn-glycerol synthase
VPLFKRRFARPVDGGKRWSDGRRILGDSKTFRGLVCAAGAAVLCAWIFGVAAATGLTVAAAAMAGDLLSSFTKRRMGKKSGDQALGLDQVPEVLLPLLATRSAFDLSWLDILMCVAIFIGVELGASRVLYALNLRKHPY